MPVNGTNEKPVSIINRLKSNDPKLDKIELWSSKAARHRKFRPEEVPHLADALRTNTVLRSLDLYNDAAVAAAFPSVADALIESGTLETLYLSGDALGSESVGPVAELMRRSTRLQVLIVRDWDVGDDGAARIARAAAESATLTKLTLNGCGIGPDGAVALAAAVERSGTIESLWLANNRIDDRGAEAIADALRGNRTLVALGLGNNEIFFPGIKAILKVLKFHNHTLEGMVLHPDVDKHAKALLAMNRNHGPTVAFAKKTGTFMTSCLGGAMKNSVFPIAAERVARIGIFSVMYCFVREMHSTMTACLKMSQTKKRKRPMPRP